MHGQTMTAGHLKTVHMPSTGGRGIIIIIMIVILIVNLFSR